MGRTRIRTQSGPHCAWKEQTANRIHGEGPGHIGTEASLSGSWKVRGRRGAAVTASPLGCSVRGRTGPLLARRPGAHRQGRGYGREKA